MQGQRQLEGVGTEREKEQSSPSHTPDKLVAFVNNYNMGLRPHSTTTPSGERKTNGKKHPPAQHGFKENPKTLGVPLGGDLVVPDRASPNSLIVFVHQLCFLGCLKRVIVFLDLLFNRFVQ